MSLRHYCILVMTGLFVPWSVQWAVAEKIGDDPPPLEAVGAEAFDAIARFYDYDKTVPPELRVVERIDRDLSIREKFVFRGVRGFLVPGYLELPKKRTAPAALVLLLHGWSGSKDSWWQDGGYISGGNMRKALLGAGYAVLAVDAPTHGDRIAENDYALVNDLRENGQPTHRNYFTLEEIVVQSTRDYRRALDFVELRDEIDSQRIGMIGYSMGGFQAFILTAVEPRIRVSVACVVPSLAGQSTSIGPKDYARGIADRPFLMLMGRTDPMCHHQHANQLLDLIPSTRKNLILFDAGHKLPDRYVNDALTWFQEHLKP
jgi:predicted esterase